MRRVSLAMHHCVHWRHRCTRHDRQPDHPFHADVAEVDFLTGCSFGGKSDEASMREIDVTHSLARFAQDRPYEKVDVLRTRFEATTFHRRQTLQQTIDGDVLIDGDRFQRT